MQDAFKLCRLTEPNNRYIGFLHSLINPTYDGAQHGNIYGMRGATMLSLDLLHRGPVSGTSPETELGP